MCFFLGSDDCFLDEEKGKFLCRFLSCFFDGIATLLLALHCLCVVLSNIITTKILPLILITCHSNSLPEQASK